MTGRTRIRLALLVVLVALGSLFTWVPARIDARYNPVVALANPAATISEPVRQLHERLLIADLHADTLVWDRDLLVRNDRGAVDLPRLIAGHVALQTFSAVTQAPGGEEYHRGAGDFDRMTPLIVAGRWPPGTWTSYLRRALHQAAKLQAAADASHDQLVIVRSQADLAGFLARRAADPERAAVAALLAVEGLQALEGRLENVDVLRAAGFRMLGLAHLCDNDIAGSLHGVQQGGLTPLGREVVDRMETLGMIVDLAHASAAAIDETLSVARRPVVVSHTGVRGTADNPRNLTDAQIDRIADGGGVIGIGYWQTAVGDVEPASIARAIRYVADRVGVEHVGLGSDFDGAVATGFDAAGLVRVTDALLGAGFDEDEIAQIMGGNVLRLFGELLPAQ